jgi:carbonic anhydrase
MGRRVASVVSLLVAVSCGGGGGAHEPTATGAEPHWSYRGADGPQAWGSLGAEYARCTDGLAQSPIAIDHPQNRALPDVHFDYRTAPAEIRDTGHSEEITVPTGSSMTLDGVPYQLAQFHFHAPSEHGIDGRSFPIEFHFVHRAGDGSLAVAAVMAVEGRENPAWEPIVRDLPAGTNVKVESLDLEALLPGDVTGTRYEGSLTTPPCSERVHWTVLDAAIEMDQRQIAAFTRHYRGNNRPHQPLNGRLVAHDSTRGD